MPNCGYANSLQYYKYIDVVLNTLYMHNMCIKLRVKQHVLSTDGFELNAVPLETMYGSTFIKVIDLEYNNLNPDIVYPLNYLLHLPSITTNPKEKNYNHDIITNVYFYLHFLEINKIDFKMENLIIVSGVRDLDNAYWNGSYLVFGRGDSVKGHTALTSSMIVGHELTHALIEQTCNLEYNQESGALNESLCDIFGLALERYLHETHGSLGVLIGSECNMLLRNMKDPHACNQPEIMYDKYWFPTSEIHDSGGVHINSGVSNVIYVQIEELIGYKKAFEMYYRVLKKLKYNSTYKDLKKALIEVNNVIHYINDQKLLLILNKHIL